MTTAGSALNMLYPKMVLLICSADALLSIHTLMVHC